MTTEKVREDRLRRMAQRQGLQLRKSRTRDPRALTFGVLQLVNEFNREVWSGRDLDGVEEYLSTGRLPTERTQP